MMDLKELTDWLNNPESFHLDLHTPIEVLVDYFDESRGESLYATCHLEGIRILEGPEGTNRVQLKVTNQ